MMVPSAPLKAVDDIMTRLIFSQDAEKRPPHKLHIPATLSINFVPPSEDHKSLAKNFADEKLKGIPIEQVTQAAKELASTLLQSMPDIFPTYRRLDSVIVW
jgi:hypothetical protein